MPRHSAKRVIVGYVSGCRSRRVFALVLASVTLAACGGTVGYASGVKKAFLGSCESNATASNCNCVLTHLEGSVSQSAFAAAERAIAAGDTVYPTWMLKAASACGGK